MAWPSPQRPHWLHLQVLTDNAVDKAGRQQRAKGLNPSHAFGSPPPPIPPFPPTNPHKPHPALSYHSPTLSHPTHSLSHSLSHSPPNPLPPPFRHPPPHHPPPHHPPPHHPPPHSHRQPALPLPHYRLHTHSGPSTSFSGLLLLGNIFASAQSAETQASGGAKTLRQQASCQNRPPSPSPIPKPPPKLPAHPQASSQTPIPIPKPPPKLPPHPQAPSQAPYPAAPPHTAHLHRLLHLPRHSPLATPLATPLVTPLAAPPPPPPLRSRSDGSVCGVHGAA